jgi:hypothetical protein
LARADFSISGNVDADEAQCRMAVGHQLQIAPGAAADFQGGAGVLQAQRRDGALATEQDEFARQVEDEPLVTVSAVHALLVATIVEHE